MLVQKCLHDNYASLSATEVDGTLRNGQTLRDRLTADKQKNKEKKGTVVMGRKYHDHLRMLYRSDNNPDAMLLKLNQSPDGRVSPDLFKAMVKAKTHPPNRAPILHFISTTNKLQEHEVIGILRLALTLRCSVSPDQHRFLLECMRFVHRTNAHKDYSMAVEVMKAKFNECLLHACLIELRASHVQ